MYTLTIVTLIPIAAALFARELEKTRRARYNALVKALGDSFDMSYAEYKETLPKA